MDNKKWFHSQFFILGGCTLIVFYLAGIPLLMLLYTGVFVALILRRGY
jgi:hypothetical protein